MSIGEPITAMLNETFERFAEPNQAVKTMIAQFKLHSAALAAEVLSAVLSN